MSPSKKTEVIEAIFDRRWDGKTQSLSKPLVTLEDVSQEIRELNRKYGKQVLSDRNPANFFKDFIRKKSSANRNWPTSVFERGYTARQETGGNACFRFVPMPDDQDEPFPVERVPPPDAGTSRYLIQSASMPVASRRLGRSDEQWLIQVITRLRLIESHLAIFSEHQAIQVDHLQSSIKLARTEIDSLYLATVIGESAEDQPKEILVTCEAKGPHDDILEEQVFRQAKTIFSIRAFDQDEVIPIALKVAGKSLIYLVEFESIKRAELELLERLVVTNRVIYELTPPVPGIGE